MIETREEKMATAEAQSTPGRRRNGRFLPKSSGNPAGRPTGSRNRTTLAAQALLDGEAEALTRKVIELALAGDPVALRLCLERILPRREERLVEFPLPEVETNEEVTSAMAAVIQAVGAGILMPGEAETMSRILEAQSKFINEVHSAVWKL